MSLEQAIFIYSVLLGVLFSLMLWMLLRYRAEKRRKAQAAAPAQAKVDTPPREPIDWLGALSKVRPDKLLTGEMWVKVVIAAFTALCAGTIVVIFVFPLGAAWAAGASFGAVVVIVGFYVLLLD